MTIDNYICSCDVPCLFNLSWLGPLRLYFPDDVTPWMLRCLGVDEEHHNHIINNMVAGGVRCFIKCNFGMVRELCVDIRLFRRLIPHLPSNNVQQVKLHGFYIDDIAVNEVNRFLCDIICEEYILRILSSLFQVIIPES